MDKLSGSSPVMDLERKLKYVFNEALRTDVIAEVFMGFVVSPPSNKQDKLKLCMGLFSDAFNFASDTEKDKASFVATLIKFIHKERTDKRVEFMFGFLEECMTKGIFPIKLVLDVLQCDELKYTKRVHWCHTYIIIRKFLHRLDYKGCRDVLRNMIMKMGETPAFAWPAAERQINEFSATLDYLLAPESHLIPGYLAVSEIRRHMPEDVRVSPWVLVGKLSRFSDRFNAVVRMASTSGRWNLLPVVDHDSCQLTTPWRLEAETLRFPLNRHLPYPKEMHQPQCHIFRHILKQGYSQEAILQVLQVTKSYRHRIPSLEMELAKLIVATMEESPCDEQTWHHLSRLLVFFLFHQLASFSVIADALHQNVLVMDRTAIQHSRDRLMWLLLQFISGSIQKNPLSDFQPVVKLIHSLYPEKEPIALPDMSKPSCAIPFSPICILIHLNRKVQSKKMPERGDNAQANNSSVNVEPLQVSSVPQALAERHEYLMNCLKTPAGSLNDRHIILVCNACSTTSELFNTPIMRLVDGIFGDERSTIPLPGTNCVAFNKIAPISVDVLDCLTAHTKLSILHQIGTRLQKQSQSKSTINLSPALVETYSRLFIYTEIESLSIEALVTQVFPILHEHQSWSLIHTLLEMISYTIHHVAPSFRIKLLSALHVLAGSPHANFNQLQQGIESTALRLIMSFDNCDLKPHLECFLSEQKQLVFQESEELNRVLVLTLARSIHRTGAETISGSWCPEVLKSIMAATPHKWPQHTLSCFPQSIQDYFRQQNVEPVNKTALKNSIEKEYASWSAVLSLAPEAPVNSKSNAEALEFFTSATCPPYFVCLVWKLLFDGKIPSLTSYKILDRVKATTMSELVRIFSDFLLIEFSASDHESHVVYCIDVLRDMVWKYNIVPLDRLILCLALRSSEPKDVQVAFFVIQYLLIKPDDFRFRVQSFAQQVDNLDHWKHGEEWYQEHQAYHQKFPENYFFEGLLTHLKTNAEEVDPATTRVYLPTYFSNITLRFLPVLDILIHRCIELLPTTSSKKLEILLDQFGLLYKFHGQPLTYLFNTLHYYEKKLRNKFSLKKKLVSAIFLPIVENKPSDWSFSKEFTTNMMTSSSSDDDVQWTPNVTYFCKLIRRLVDTIHDRRPAPFASRDWRFNEYPNAASHALHVTCVEILSLPLPSDQIVKALMNVVLRKQVIVPIEDIFSWMNAIGLVLSSLPEAYWRSLHDVIIEVIKSDELTADVQDGASYPYELLAFDNKQATYNDRFSSRLIALTHVVWQHMSIGQLSLVPAFLKEELKRHVRTELQLLFVFHLIGPSFPRFHNERSRCLTEVAAFLYEIVLETSERHPRMHFADQIADFLYHVKYMHVGTMLNDKIQVVVSKLPPPMQKRLQFICQQPQAQPK